MPGSFDFEIRASSDGRGRPREEGAPFDLLVLGELGSTGAGHPVEITTDTFDDVFARLSPRVRLDGVGEGGAPFVHELRSFEGFRPESLVRSLPALATLAALRAVASSEAPAAPPPPAEKPAAEDDSATMERLLGKAPEPRPGTDFVERLVRDAVAPHVVPAADPRTAEIAGAAGSALGAALRKVLRDPGFRRLEGSWASLRRLVHDVAPGGPVRVFVLPTGKDALGSASLRKTAEGFDLCLADFEIAGDDPVLAGLAALGAPVLAGASGAPPASRSRRIALVAPRILARPPYGAATDPVEGFPFEEAEDDPGDEGFCWASGAWTCARAIVAAVAAGDPDPLTLANAAVDDLPFAIYTTPGGRKIRPAAEVALTEAEAEAWAESGLVPIVADPRTGGARIVRLSLSR